MTQRKYFPGARREFWQFVGVFFYTRGFLGGRVFVLYDDCPCLVYGPVSKDIHAFDERVSLASVQRITGTIALFIANWCGLEKLS
ncbi:MAG: hypothetical protein Ct9H300mP14_13300 [Gammaproteobacteria bacterium]|nr:MAG: hypothetical protein Ct9H300mP14_13300 [Gammaproteobacteria bacterium]